MSLPLGKESVTRVLACSTGSTRVPHPQEVQVSELSGASTRPVLGVAVDGANMQCWREPISTEVHTKASLSRKSGTGKGVA